MNIDAIFKNCKISQELKNEFVKEFKTLHFKAGENIFVAGEVSEHLYIIESGELMVINRDMNNQECILSILGPDKFVGVVGVLNDIPRSTTVRALSHAQVYQLSKEKFSVLMESNESFRALIYDLIQEKEIALIPSLSRLENADYSKLNKHFQRKSIEAGEVLCEQGVEAEKLFLITKGRANNIRYNRDGSQTNLGIINPIGSFGDYEFFKEKAYRSQLVMQEKGEMLSIEKEKLYEVAKEHPSILAALPIKKAFLSTVASFFHSKEAYFSIPFFSMNRPKVVSRFFLILMFVLMIPAALPSIWPEQFPYLNGMKIDTDPENMLPKDDPARVFHNQMKDEMDLYEIMVVGVVNEKHKDGIYNPESLQKIYELAEFAKTQHWLSEDGKKSEGVLEVDIMAPSNVDNISQAGPGSISFSWLMKSPPKTREESLALRESIKRLPLMNNTLASLDDKAMALYLPLSSKDVSYRVYHELKEKIATFNTQGNEQYYITGLPVAEDLFGVEMFVQMAVSAPMAMLVVFILMYLFFRNLTLITAPMIVAVFSVIITMSLLVITGQTIHIMSSMIAIFIMPIAVLDSVHILSEFFDYYPRIKNRRLTMEHVMRELFVPMLFTSVTTAIGFASLALVPIPPVQVFGIFVAIGVVVAWLLSISIIPAYIFLVPREKIEALAVRAQEIEALKEKEKSNSSQSFFSKFLQGLRVFTLKYAKTISIASGILVLIFIYGISKIEVNDNPVRWFKEGHEINVADKVLNEHFAGTYMAYIALKSSDADSVNKRQDEQKIFIDEIGTIFNQYPESLELRQKLVDYELFHKSGDSWLEAVEQILEDYLDSDDLTDVGEVFAEEVLDLVDQKKSQREEFKNPEVLRYMARLQEELSKLEMVGKTTSIADFIKTINRELHGEDEAYYTIPNTSQAVAQSLLTYQNSHRPHDVYRFIAKDYRGGIIWVMLNSGDNSDMSKVVEVTEKFFLENPPPVELEMNWFGLNYINVIWQEKMVNGMMLSILGSYLAVFFIMIFLLRSVAWGLVAMVPLTLTLLVIYGVLGLVGKSYDMPVAVLSALSIGLAVDFSIHFLTRIRHIQSQTSDWQESLQLYFNEPAQAIVRNILVVAIGFTPLLFAPLVPYNTVGILIGAILFTSGIATLVIIPVLLKLFNKSLFPSLDQRRTTLLGAKDLFIAFLVFFLIAGISLNGFYPFSVDTLSVYIGFLIFIISIYFYKSIKTKVN